MLTACSTDTVSRMLHDDSDRVTFTATTDRDDAATTTRGLISEATGTPFLNTQAGRPLMLSTTVTPRTSGTVPSVRQEQGDCPSTSTRGQRFEGAAADLTAFRVSAIKTDQEVSTEDFAEATPDFFYNLKATKNTDDVFRITQDYYWPATSEKLWFYAYTFMPYSDDNQNVVVSAQTAGGPQKVTFTVDPTVTNQVDLMTANTETQAFNNSGTGTAKKAAVPLSFRHELTAIRFVIGEQWLAGSVKSVAIRNVHGVGTLTIGGGWAWTDEDGQALTANNSYALTLNKGGLSGTQGEEIMDGDFSDQYFLMIPQSFDDNDNAVLEVTYQDGAQEYTVTAPLKGQAAWERNTTVTYAISSHTLTTLKIGSIAWPVTNETQTWEGPKTDFVAGDEVGLYVVNPDGKTIPENHRNIKCTYDGEAWTIAHPTGDPVYKLPGYQYFFYYPYTPTPDTKYPVQGQNTTDTSASDFFGTLVNGWSPAAIQNDEGKLNAQDLQIAKAVDHAQLASTVNAQMTHQMNIGILTLTDKEVNTTITYKIDDSYSWVHGGGVSTIAASADFIDNLPYQHTNGKYYFVFKPVTTLEDPGTQIKANNTGGTVDWSRYLQSTSRGIKIVDDNVTTSLASTARTDTYTLQLYDLYYSTGAISHSLITGNSNYGEVIGLVTYIGNQTNGNGTISGRTHGLVLAKSDYHEGDTYEFYFNLAVNKPALFSPVAPTSKSSAWMIPRVYQWQRMFIAAGGGISSIVEVSLGNTENMATAQINYGNFLSNISDYNSSGIESMTRGTYWTSDKRNETEYWNSWHWHIGGQWDNESPHHQYAIRCCLAF